MSRMLPLSVALISLVLYGTAAVQLIRAFRRSRQQRNSAALALGAAAVIGHAYVVQDVLFVAAGLDLSFAHTLSLAACVMGLLLVLLSLTQPVENLGMGLFPLAGLALMGQVALGSSGPEAVLSGANAGLDIHVLVSLIAHAVLGLAALQAIVFGIQHRLLHDHQPTGAVRTLPPLRVMETLLLRMIAIGFALLTLALASGFVYLEDLFAQHLVHKTVLTMAAWAVFAVLLGGHWWAGWRGPTAVRFTLGAFALLVLGYFGSKLVLELILERP